MSTLHPRPGRARRRSLVTAALLLTAPLVGCSGGEQSTQGEAAFSPDHVHGLAEEPGTGRLLLATHDGLFALRADGDAPSAVGELNTDLMGFTVTAGGDYYASGHPGPGEEGPAALGLITSGDAGQTWQGVSLAGEADFHALDAAGSALYGVDGAVRLLRSVDAGLTWSERTLPEPVADVAADPGSDALVATSEAGLLLSTDAGESFSPLTDAPLLMLVDWAEDGGLVGISPTGQVHTAEDADDEWSEQATVDGAVQAMTVTTSGAVYVSTQDELLRSDDGGSTFSTVTSY
ncbi:F510_1955 family glycosylhydrolase [Nocardioides cremeus]|jgi:hypothetical protein|uniref:Exo-alpha-sialidase n=1 Tax=Nocardioides cremeus TaxID=3058044 RepID=A0ABT8TXI8_9ACTN|nr:hypothetical protein [Nocardioides cremeus]MDO3397097.1 hypothetical protein [Nocardioides cremeus]